MTAREQWWFIQFMKEHVRAEKAEEQLRLLRTPAPLEMKRPYVIKRRRRK